MYFNKSKNETGCLEKNLTAILSSVQEEIIVDLT
jgi:hypothetical protein